MRPTANKACTKLLTSSPSTGGGQVKLKTLSQVSVILATVNVQIRQVPRWAHSSTVGVSGRLCKKGYCRASKVAHLANPTQPILSRDDLTYVLRTYPASIPPCRTHRAWRPQPGQSPEVVMALVTRLNTLGARVGKADQLIIWYSGLTSRYRACTQL